MSYSTTAEQVFDRVLKAREAYTNYNEATSYGLVKLEIEQWLTERGAVDEDRDLAMGLFQVTTLAPFASELYHYAHLELKDTLEQIEADWLVNS